MAFGNGPRIVTDGLVLALDAADRNSYPGSGTTWSDMSGNGNNGTLTNGPTFSSANGGAIVFDGTNDYVLCSNISSSINQNITISSWINFTIFDGIGFSIIQIPVEQPTVDLTYLYIYRNSFWDNGQLSFLCTYIKTDNTIATRQHYSSTNYFKSNTWYNLVAMYDSTGRSKFYANGSLLVNTAPDAQFSRWVSVIGTPYFQYIINGLSSGLQIYNKALTDSEILQNYNAQKSRFGL